MGCGCNKKNNQKPVTTESNTENTQPSLPMEFRPAVAPVATNRFSQGISMVKSFATAIASRGINNEKVNKPIKQLRVLSCFGNSAQGGELTPCEYLRQSETPGKFFCGGCGCGDKPSTWLMAEENQYSKLDYPKLNCPLNMPGFTNYQPSGPDEANSPITRRYYIENMDFNKVLATPVSVPAKPETPPETTSEATSAS
jgi:hypothetical protein